MSVRSNGRRAALLVRVAATMSVVSVALRFETTQDVLRRMLGTCALRRPERATLDRVRRYVDLLLFRIPFPGADGRCVPRSIVIARFARQLGFDARVQFGIRRTSDGLMGHAWVVIDGAPVFEAPGKVEQFEETFQFPTGGRVTSVAPDIR
ncbi:MAG: lasso peptide biosynthesis B2 protein [Deltaproteobacteria bacterium]|jgi:hypothetical protein